MRRKINKVGPNTLTVSLPSSWVKKYNIKPGDELEIEENGATLELSGGKGISLGEFKIKFQKDNHSYLKSIVGNSYKKGYSKIVITYDEEDMVWEIQKIVDSLIGIEVLSRTKNQCEIIALSQELEEEFDSIFKNSFILVLENSNELYEDLLKSKFHRLDSIIEKNNIITKYVDFCKRILNKHRRSDINVIFQYLIIWNIEKISNEYKYIYKYCVDSNFKNPSKDLLGYVQETNKLLLLYYQAYYEKNMNKIREISKRKEEMIYISLYPLIKKLRNDEMGVLHHSGIIVRRIWDSCGPLLGLNF